MTTPTARVQASQASDRLTVALLTLASQGLRTNCSEPETHHYWLSDWPAERELAVRACHGCPVITECGEAATANDERHGVWGGVDRSRPARAKRSKQTGSEDDLFSSVA
jgi:hypothetical protein